MIKRLIASAALALTIGCASTTTVIGPDNTEHQLISCGPIKQCYEKAHEVCSGPYKIINTTSDTVGNSKSASSVTELLVKCGRS